MIRASFDVAMYPVYVGLTSEFFALDIINEWLGGHEKRGVGCRVRMACVFLQIFFLFPVKYRW